MEKVKAINIMRFAACLAVISVTPMSLFPLSSFAFPDHTSATPNGPTPSVAPEDSLHKKGAVTTPIDSILAYYDSI